jgi:hypothetical protein
MLRYLERGLDGLDEKNFGERSEARKRRSVFSEDSLSNGNL